MTNPMYADTVYGYINRSLPSSKTYSPQLISNTADATMAQAISSLLGSCQSFVFSVAFITSDGLAVLMEALNSFTGRGTIITSTYLDFNEPDTLLELLKFDNIDVYLADERRGFHAKGYVFRHELGVTAIVGSSNLTANALKVNSEWNLRFSSDRDGDVADQLDAAVQAQIDHAAPLTAELIARYEARRRKRVFVVEEDQPLQVAGDDIEIVPNAMQANALEALEQLYEAGEKRGLIISATGTGKTILAALAVRNVAPKRFLFVVHREQILKKAVSEFQKVLKAPDSDFGFFAGSSRNTDAKYVFATIQSLSRGENRQMFARSAFDYIMIDEVHRAGAESYRKVIDYFTPQFLLGLSATPERTDGFNVFELFDYNVPYEIRLREALAARMLAPFHYYGITDYEGLHAESSIESLTSDQRADYIVSKLEGYGLPRHVRGLMFCSRNAEAEALSAKLNERRVSGRLLRTQALSGEVSVAEREEAIADLEAGLLDYLITVDIFNEGIDIPSINQVVLLRPTKSAIIFTQQLGRGLRKAQGKSHVRIIDFIANYDTNYLIPVALGGDNSGSKNNLRKIVRTAHIDGPSSVSFDRVATEKILSSLEKANLTGRREIKAAIDTLHARLNHLPRLADFVTFDLLDPDIVAANSAPFNYWSLLVELKKVGTAPTAFESNALKFLSVELLPGKRPHELLILRELLKGGALTRSRVREILDEHGTTSDKAVIDSTIRVLTGMFYKDRDLERYGGAILSRISDVGLELHPDIAEHYTAYAADTNWFSSFKGHVDDLIETGLKLCKIRGNWLGDLRLGEQYSRKDVCRLAGWKQNETATMFGYKIDQDTNMCPIFVTYHKDPEADLSISYEDAFEAPDRMVWMTKSGRTTSSPTEKAIIAGKVDLHLFVKKHDSEGSVFYYMGKVKPGGAMDTTMPGDNGRILPVVRVDLELESAVEESLYTYITSAGR